LVSACGSEVAGSSGSSSAGASSTPAAGGTSGPTSGVGTIPTPGSAGQSTPGELVSAATVLEKPGAGAQLCLGGIATSLPPQCGGPVIDNWDWAAAPPHESANGVRWGAYVVIGLYDAAAQSFHLTRPVTTVETYDGPALTPRADAAFTTPCPPPAGGWRVVDPATATLAAQEAALSAAAKLPTYSGAWLDQSINPADPEKQPEAMNDPTRLILNIRVTRDAAATEAALRAIWGGPLCVIEGGRSEAELRGIQRELSTAPGMLGSFVDSVTSTVSMDVMYDDGALAADLDKRYGAGVVRVHSALQPYVP
ncbi:MAG: hypothetical protein WAT47_11010, partial [Nostocoides sp.]